MRASNWTTRRTLSDFLFRVKVTPGKHRRFYLFGVEF